MPKFISAQVPGLVLVDTDAEAALDRLDAMSLGVPANFELTEVDNVDEITADAVKVLNSLVKLKGKVDSTQAIALQAHKHFEAVFNGAEMAKGDIDDCLAALKRFATASQRYQAAKGDAAVAKITLSEVLRDA